MARTTFRLGQEIDPHTLNYFSEIVMEAIRQLRLALGTGYIFYGFDVRENKDSGFIEISPGLAFDGAGQAVALDTSLSLPPPVGAEPIWLGLRHHLLVDERDVAGRPIRERDSVEVVWLPSVPRDDETIPLARLQHRPVGWLIDRSVARRAPSLPHRHTGTTIPDHSRRLRYDGVPVGPAVTGGEVQLQQIARLEGAVASEFAKINARLDDLYERQRLHDMEAEELRTEVAEAVERPAVTQAAGDEEWRDALAALREELSVTVGEEVREELDLLRAEVAALSKRPASVGTDRGSFTSVKVLHGVGETHVQRLREAGIETVSDLLAATATPEGRRRLEVNDLSLAQLRRWSREADLLRLHGVGPGQIALLNIVGVHSTAELATQEPSLLFSHLREAAQERGDVAPPPLAWAESWIEQAKHIPPVVEW
ncbi:MAG: DUF4332 domain-containing protein [Chloroflexota bacterium]|nr:DUF4332 domain-containing protein [Chloroflexota bacterium]